MCLYGFFFCVCVCIHVYVCGCRHVSFLCECVCSFKTRTSAQPLCVFFQNKYLVHSFTEHLQDLGTVINSHGHRVTRQLQLLQARQLAHWPYIFHLSSNTSGINTNSDDNNSYNNNKHNNNSDNTETCTARFIKTLIYQLMNCPQYGCSFCSGAIYK